MIDQPGYADDLVVAGRQLSGGADLEDVLLMLRQRGCSQIGCIRIVHTLTACSLGEAKGLVHDSRAWEDVRERNERLHKALVEEISSEVESWE